MNSNEHLRQLLEAVASGLYTHHSGVRVTWSQDGKSAYTDGRTVFLPKPSREMTSGDWRVLQGYIDHEVGHVQHSDTTSPEIIHAPKSLRKVTNIFEDARINRAVTSKWVGSKVNLGALYQRCADELNADEASRMASESSPVAHRLNALNFKLSGFKPSTWTFSDADNAWAQRWADEFHRTAGTASSTAAMQDIARRCLIDLKQTLEDEQKPKHPQPDGEGEAGDKDDTCSGNSGESEAKGKGKGSGSGDAGKGKSKPESKPDGSESKPDESKSESDGEPESEPDGESKSGGDGESEGEGVHGHGHNPNTTSDGGNGAADSGCSGDVDIDKEMEALADGMEQALAGATGTDVDAKEDGEVPDSHNLTTPVNVGECEIDCHTGKITHPKLATSRHSSGYETGKWYKHALHSDAEQKRMEASRGKGGSLASHLERVLKARAVGHLLHRQEEGERLDRSSFSAIATGTHGGRVWEQDIKGDVTSACVGIYIDGSGSMTERMPLRGGGGSVSKCSAAGFATRIVVEALERCGIATEVGIWDSGTFDFNGAAPTPRSYAVGIRNVIAKRFDRPFRGAEVARITQPFADGGTPMALSAAVLPSRLGKRKEQRKIAIIMTDGVVSANEAKEFDANCVIAKRAGVEVIVVGIGTSLQNIKHKHKVAATYADDLPEALSACLPTILLSTRSEVRR